MGRTRLTDPTRALILERGLREDLCELKMASVGNTGNTATLCVKINLDCHLGGI